MINNNSKKSQTGLNNFDNIKDTQETGNTGSHGEKLLSCLEQSHPAEHSWGQPSLQQIHSCVNNTNNYCLKLTEINHRSAVYLTIMLQ